MESWPSRSKALAC